MVIGFLKPMILMPAAAIAQLSLDQLETILLHELAHIKRYDYLVNILQVVVETILFFNPFVWMVSSITRQEREHCCDDLVLAYTEEPLTYAIALSALATHPGAAGFSVAATGQSDHLFFNRIKRITEMKKNPFSYSRMIAAILIFAAITCSVAVLTPSFAKTKKDKPKENAVTPKTVQKDIPQPGQSEESILINKMIGDGLLDQIKGFTVEKMQNKLYINGHEQTAKIANKYLPMIKQDVMRVQVYSFPERLQQHPDESFIQILLPVSLSSPCVDYKPRKDTC